MYPRSRSEHALLVEGRSYSSDDLELIVAESCAAAYRQGWDEGYVVGSRYAHPVLGVPRRDLEKWLARVLLVLLGLAGTLALTAALLGGG